jgi:hypothetical protein
MIVCSSKMFFSDVSFNSSDAFDGSNPAAWISALIDHFRFVVGRSDASHLIYGKQVFDDSFICCGSARA